MKTVLALMLVTACGVSHDTDDQETSPPLVVAGPKSGSPSAMPPPAYRLVPVPAGISGSTAAKLVCADSTVVGSQDFPNNARAIVFDYLTLTTTDLGSLGGSISKAHDGNASGTFVGASTPVSGGGKAFVYRDGVMSALPGIGGDESIARGINAQGQIVGQAQVPGTGDVDQHAILWEPGCAAAIDLGTLDGGYSFARAINNAGVIVGTASVGNGVNSHAVMWGPDHRIVDLGAGAGLTSQAMDINASGLIAGVADNRAVVIDNGQFIDLGTLGGPGAFATALNDRGDVVGSSSLQFSTTPRVFLYSNGTMVDVAALVDAPGWQIREASDICDNGVIAGNGIFEGQTRGFVLIPNE